MRAQPPPVNEAQQGVRKCEPGHVRRNLRAGCLVLQRRRRVRRDANVRAPGRPGVHRDEQAALAAFHDAELDQSGAVVRAQAQAAAVDDVKGAAGGRLRLWHTGVVRGGHRSPRRAVGALERQRLKRRASLQPPACLQGHARAQTRTGSTSAPPGRTSAPPGRTSAPRRRARADRGVPRVRRAQASRKTRRNAAIFIGCARARPVRARAIVLGSKGECARGLVSAPRGRASAEVHDALGARAGVEGLQDMLHRGRVGDLQDRARLEGAWRGEVRGERANVSADVHRPWSAIGEPKQAQSRRARRAAYGAYHILSPPQ